MAGDTPIVTKRDTVVRDFPDDLGRGIPGYEAWVAIAPPEYIERIRAQERERWKRLCSERADASREAARLSRGDGDDEQAEIYVGQALAYESLPGLLDGDSDGN